MPNRKQYIDILSRIVKQKKEFNDNDPVKISLECVEDILELLKEQEPTVLLENPHKPYGISTNANSPWISRCPRFGKKIEGKKTKFCKYCGQKVKWSA